MSTPTRAVPVVAAGESFEGFYRANLDPIYRALALALGEQDLAREATDEAFARAYQHWSKVRHHDNPTGWVYRVGFNWATSRFRRRKHLSSAAVPERSTTDRYALNPELHRALRDLKPHARSVVVLRYLLDWSVEDTAAALDVAPGTVKSRLSRALEQLRSALEER